MLKVGMIGLGLIGGSLAKSIRLHHKDAVITAYDTNRDSLAAALEEKVISKALTKIDDFTSSDAFYDCDFIFLCTPVESFHVYLPLLKKVLKEDTVLTDVGSVKARVHKEMEEYGLNKYFIGGHPMAGTEKEGYENSFPEMMNQTRFLLTPAKESSEAALEKYKELICSLDAIPMVLDYKEHDRAVAAISHVPHLVASGLVDLVASKDEKKFLNEMAAGGFKDITRIASSNPHMWQNICFSNKVAVLEMLDSYISIMQQARENLAAENVEGLCNHFAVAKEYRDKIN